eukprot:jgi/Chlat1/3911/Chrsp26S04184
MEGLYGMPVDADKKRKLNDGEALGSGMAESLNGGSGGAANPNGLLLSKTELKEMLEPFNKDQLVDMLAEAGSRVAFVQDMVRDNANKDPAHRKLFVRGLAWETTTDALLQLFCEYGEIEEGSVIQDKTTGKSKGYGFITYKHMDSARRALGQPQKSLDGRYITCNLAAAGNQALGITPSSGGIQETSSLRKLYVGGLSYDTMSDTLHAVFSQFGDLEEASVITDKNTNKSRGFGFVTFRTVEGAKKALVEPNKTIDGRVCHCNLAASGEKKATTPTTSVLSQYGVPSTYNYAAAYPQAGAQQYSGPQPAQPTQQLQQQYQQQYQQYAQMLAAAQQATGATGAAGLPSGYSGASGQYYNSSG